VAKDHSQLLNERTKTQNDLDQLKITTNDLISSRDEMIQDKDNIDSTDCVAYFNRLVDELDISITSNKSKMLGYKDKLLELSESINDIVRSETEVKEKYADFNKIVVILAETTAQLNDSESALVSLRKEKNTFITAFTQFLDSQNIIKECEKKLIKIQDECVKIKELIDIFQDILTQEDVMRRRLESLNSEYESATPNLDKMEAEAISARQLLEDESISIEQSKRKYLVTGAYRDILDEVWSYITQRIIPQLNSKLPYYTERLGLGFSMKINPRDITKPVFSGRPGISSLSLKDDLSDGQKRLISLALAHSLRDMEASVRGIEVGWLIIDEFANSLSPQLVEQVINFEKDFAKEKNVSLIVISHDVPLKSFQWDHRTTITRDTYSRIHQKF
jgi:DNA repair exonuclease SbcCD ATPase subunit